MPFESGLTSHQLQAASLFLTARIVFVVVSLSVVSCRSSLCFSFVVCGGSQADLQIEAGLGEEDNSHRLLLALLPLLWQGFEASRWSLPMLTCLLS